METRRGSDSPRGRPLRLFKRASWSALGRATSANAEVLGAGMWPTGAVSLRRDIAWGISAGDLLTGAVSVRIGLAVGGGTEISCPFDTRGPDGGGRIGASLAATAGWLWLPEFPGFPGATGVW